MSTQLSINFCVMQGAQLEALKVLTLLLAQLGKAMTEHAPQLMQHAWQLLSGEPAQCNISKCEVPKQTLSILLIAFVEVLLHARAACTSWMLKCACRRPAAVRVDGSSRRGISRAGGGGGE